MRALTIDTKVIYQHGQALFRSGALRCIDYQPAAERFVYEVDGNFGDYRIEIRWNGTLAAACDCPYPGVGCKHAVAVLLDLLDRQGRRPVPPPAATKDFLSADEIRQQALEDRQRKMKKEEFTVTPGDMLKGDRLVTTARGRQYQVTLHDPAVGSGHCTCPDFLANRLSTCKHLLHLHNHLRKGKRFQERLTKERFPYIDIFWDAAAARPRLFHEQSPALNGELRDLLEAIFDGDGLFRSADPLDFLPYIDILETHKPVRIQEQLLHKLSKAASGHGLHRRPAGDGHRQKTFGHRCQWQDGQPEPGDRRGDPHLQTAGILRRLR